MSAKVELFIRMMEPVYEEDGFGRRACDARKLLSKDPTLFFRPVYGSDYFKRHGLQNKVGLMAEMDLFTTDQQHRIEKIDSALDLSPERKRLLVYDIFTDSSYQGYDWGIVEFLDRTIPGWMGHLPVWAPFEVYRSYVAQHDRPKEKMKDYLRYFDGSDELLKDTTEKVIRNLFSQKPEYAEEIIKALNFMRKLYNNPDGKEIKRRTGEPFARHIDRGLLRLASYCSDAQINSLHKADDIDIFTYGKDNSSVTFETIRAQDMQRNFSTQSQESNMRPFDEENLPVTFAGFVAFVLHDFLEDFQKVGYDLKPVGNKLVILKNEIIIDRLSMQDKNIASMTYTMIKAYSKREYRRGLLTDDEDTIKQVENIYGEVFGNDLPLLAKYLVFGGKLADRMDNLDTYMDIKGRFKDGWYYSPFNLRRDKLFESWIHFSSFDEYVWGWRFRQKIIDRRNMLPPTMMAHLTLRFLGSTLEEMYLPGLKAAEKYKRLHKIKRCLVIPDPYRPVIISDKGEMIEVMR